MKLAAADWSTALKLLDEALDRPAADRAAWLESMAPAHRHLLPLLRQLLDDRRAIETGDFLQALPPLPAAATPAGFAVGHRIGPWALLRELGQGGMASVWLAERADGAHKREVALKLPWLGARARVIGERFAREREILSALTHPHIASVLDAGVDGAQPWLALEYVQGQPLTVYAQVQGLNTAAKLRLFLQVLQAVQHAHAQLVIHRDLKPSNVMVDEQGQVKLLDFGVAKLLDDDGASRETELTQLGGRAMTPQYASPEQVAGHTLGTASDVYSLGVLLYELLTGKLPYTLKRDTPAALEEAILAANVQPPSTVALDKGMARALRGDLDTIVMKALAAASAARYASAAALAEDIQRHLQSLPIAARPAGLRYRLGRWLRRHAVVSAAGAAVALALVGGLVATSWQAERANREARNARAANDFLVRLFEDNDPRVNTPQVIAGTTALELIERGSRRLEGTQADGLAEAPEARARLLATLSQLYSGMGQLLRAVQLREQSVAAWRQLPGQQLRVAEGLMNLSVLTLAMDRDADAERHAREGLAVLAGQGGEAVDRERGNLYARLGDVLWRQDPAAAEDTYRQAVALLSKKPVKEDEYPSALNGLAWVLNVRGETAEAQALLQTMRRERVSRWGADSSMVAAVDRDLADFQSSAGQLSEALRTSERVVASLQRTADPASVELTTARFGQAVILQELERHGEALAIFQATEKSFEARGDGNFVYVAASAAGAAVSLIELGRLDEARPLAQRAVQLLGEKAPEHGATTYALAAYARVLAMDGRYAEAQQVQARLHRSLDGSSPFRSRIPAVLFVREAEMELQRGDTAAATALLDKAAARIQKASPFHQRVLDTIDARRAQVELAQGRPQDALGRASAALARQRQATEPTASARLQAELSALVARAQPASSASR